MNRRPNVLCLVGPTASGKTELAIELARRVNAEIISADSMQVYRGMDILSAKPTPAQRRQIRHHLIDILDPQQEYSAAMFAGFARQQIQDIARRGKIPLVVGGTGLYVRALVHGLFEEKRKDEALRQKLQARAAVEGVGSLMEELKKIDPETAGAIDPCNPRRIIRALEVYYSNGVPLSRLKRQTQGIAAEYKVLWWGITRERGELCRRIAQRVTYMFEHGVVEEVRRLLSLPPSRTARQALGIMQIKGLIDGTYSLDQAQEILTRDTCRYAKRQMTWFRKEEDITWFVPDPGITPGRLCRTMLASYPSG